MRVRIRAAAALCSVLLAIAASKQQVYVTLCEVHFAVTDRTGLFVRDLGPADFTVYDNDRPQEISTFVQRVQSPVSVALVLDRSQSLSDRLPFVMESAAEFTKAVIRGRDDLGMVVAFDSKVYLLQNWTSDSATLVASIRKLTAAGGTSMFDALLKTCRDQFDGTDDRQKVAVLVTDGEDTTSVATFEEALRMAKLARVVVYVLGVRAENSLNSRELQGRRVLTSLAELTGGRVFYPADYGGASLAVLFGRLQDELRNGYRLTYYLDVPPDNTFHRIRLEPKNRTLTVRAPTGYFARAPRLPQ
jgi:Ca-activated chloride channel family protein